MIESTSSSDRASRANAIQPEMQQTAQARYRAGRDSLSTPNSQSLQDALERQPEIRPDVVARGRELAADPSYPSASIIQNVAAQIVNAPDLTEDES